MQNNSRNSGPADKGKPVDAEIPPEGPSVDQPDHSNKESTLSSELERLMDEADGVDIPLGTVFSTFGDKGFGLLLVILSLPSALPVPAAGYSTPFGILLMALGIQMVMNKPRPVLPRFAEKLSLKPGLVKRMSVVSNKILHFLESFIRPRMQWINGPLGLPFMGLLVIIMACLMILPIPMTNTAPAAVIFILGIGLMEKDGLFAAFANVLGVIAVCLYAGVIWLLVAYGPEGVSQLKVWIKELLGMAALFQRG